MRREIFIYYNGNLIHKEIKKSDIGRCTIKTLEKFNNLNEDTFEFLRQDRTSRFDLLKQKSEVTDNEEKYRKYRVHRKPEVIFKGMEFYVARNWGKSNTERFIEKMKNRFPNLEYENIG